MTLYVLFVDGEIYSTDKSEHELRDTVYKMEIDGRKPWRVERYESAGMVYQTGDRVWDEDE